MFDYLGDRMKIYERAETGRRFLPLLPIVARIDGKAFHTWTKNLNRPFDADMIRIMQRTTKRLIEETGARFGYTQSDEISLVFYSDNIESQIFFDGKIFKMTSVLASITTAIFNDIVQKLVQELRDKAGLYNADVICSEMEKTPEYERLSAFGNKPPAIFDCRVWQMPTAQETINYIIWREADAIRNSIQSVGQANFSHKQLHEKNQKEIQEMLFQEKGINWNDFSTREKRGIYLHKTTIAIPFSAEEINNLPPKHEARKNPNLHVERTVVAEMTVQRFNTIKNPIEVVFQGAFPELMSEED